MGERIASHAIGLNDRQGGLGSVPEIEDFGTLECQRYGLGQGPGGVAVGNLDFLHRVGGTYTTNQSGQIVIDELQAGTYNIAEIKAPAGYTLDSTSKSFTLVV